MKEPILFIAGGKWQKPFVKYLKDKGHHVSVVNPVVTETTKLADVHVMADVNDADAISRHVASVRPAVVTSDQSDISTAIVARLNRELGLPGNGPDVIEKFTNKHAMYEFGVKCGIPVPTTVLVSDPADVRRLGHEHGYPVIIKPTDATMSRGFRKFDSEADVTSEALEGSLRFSKSGRVIAQKFVAGDMVTLEGVCSGGKHRTVATSLKDGFFTAGINTGVRYPCKLPPALLDEMIRENDKYVEASGMTCGLTHSEYIVGGGAGFCLIEIGARGGGAGIIDKIVPWVSAVNPYDVLYESLIGGTVDVKALSLKRRHALLKYYRREDVAGCDQGVAEAVRRLPGVADFQYDFIGQQYVTDAIDIRHSMGIYLGETDEQVEEVAASVARLVSPRGAP